MKGRRSGFTLVEMLMVVTVVGVLSSIVVPKFREMRRSAHAAQLAGDFSVIRHAALSFYGDSGYFPQEAAAGSVPANLKPYLPEKFEFRRADWTIDYQNWTLMSWQLVGVEFSTPDPALGLTAVRKLGQAQTITVGGVHLVVISGL